MLVFNGIEFFPMNSGIIKAFGDSERARTLFAVFDILAKGW